MGKIIAIHSYKGGTGKTSFSVNLAATYARRGKDVCLLDLCALYLLGFIYYHRNLPDAEGTVLILFHLRTPINAYT